MTSTSLQPNTGVTGQDPSNFIVDNLSSEETPLKKNTYLMGIDNGLPPKTRQVLETNQQIKSPQIPSTEIQIEQIKVKEESDSMENQLILSNSRSNSKQQHKDEIDDKSGKDIVVQNEDTDIGEQDFEIVIERVEEESDSMENQLIIADPEEDYEEDYAEVGSNENQPLVNQQQNSVSTNLTPVVYPPNINNIQQNQQQNPVPTNQVPAGNLNNNPQGQQQAIVNNNLQNNNTVAQDENLRVVIFNGPKCCIIL